MSNYKESDFGTKLKRFFANRATLVTCLTLFVAVAVVVAVTVSANRSKTPATGIDTTPVSTPADTHSNPSGGGQETLPVYHGQETQPVGGESPAEPTFALPVLGQLFKDHDATLQVYSATMGDYRVHLGIDIVTEAEAPVFAAADGTVSKIWEDSLMGHCVAVSHAGDVVTIYKNLAKDLAAGITQGASVKSGQQLGCVGDSAILEMADEPHLHFEMTIKGLAVDPLDYFAKKDVESLSKDTAFEDSAVTTANTQAGK